MPTSVSIISLGDINNNHPLVNPTRNLSEQVSRRAEIIRRIGAAYSLGAVPLDKSTFPFMRLPPELRKMVYREVLAPDSATESFTRSPSTVDHNFQFTRRFELDNFKLLQDEFANSGITTDELSATSDIGRHADHLLLVDKAVSGEAMAVLYNQRYFNMRVGRTLVCQGTVIRGLADLMSVDFFTWWPKIRNIKITFDETSILMGRNDARFYSHLMKTTAMLCHEMVIQFGRLNNIIVELPCFCSALKTRGVVRAEPLQRHPAYCMSSTCLGYLLGPIAHLRANKITLHSCCIALDKVQQTFDHVTADVTNNTPPMIQSHVWFDLRKVFKQECREIGIVMWCLPDYIYQYHAQGDVGDSMFLAFYLNERTMLTEVSKLRKDLVKFRKPRPIST
ncbi:MAG: hypothetical protein Q9212_001719 [Teloschistes hypoglaucus]